MRRALHIFGREKILRNSVGALIPSLQNNWLSNSSLSMSMPRNLVIAKDSMPTNMQIRSFSKKKISMKF